MTVILHSGNLSTPPLIAIGFDPGLTTGYAVFNNGIPGAIGQLDSLDELTDFLEGLPYTPDLIVMEKYALWKWMALEQSGSKMEVAQAEGIIKSYARRKRVELIEQAPSVLGNAKLWTGVNHKQGNHAFSHWKSAYNHMYFYLIKNGMVDIPSATN